MLKTEGFTPSATQFTPSIFVFKYMLKQKKVHKKSSRRILFKQNLFTILKMLRESFSLISYLSFSRPGSQVAVAFEGFGEEE